VAVPAEPRLTLQRSPRLYRAQQKQDVREPKLVGTIRNQERGFRIRRIRSPDDRPHTHGNIRRTEEASQCRFDRDSAVSARLPSSSRSKSSAADRLLAQSRTRGYVIDRAGRRCGFCSEPATNGSSSAGLVAAGATKQVPVLDRDRSCFPRWVSHKGVPSGSLAGIPGCPRTSLIVIVSSRL
jgi:hypothetical protein